MKHLIRLVLIILIIVISATPVMGATWQEVTIIATPMVSGGIADFTIEYVSDSCMRLSWTLTGDAVNIMIRAKYGMAPDNIPDSLTAPSDGYLVFYGDGIATTTIDDTSLDLTNNVGPIFYAAWAQKADSSWYTDQESLSEESRAVIILTIGLITLALTIYAWACYNRKSMTASAMLHSVCIILWIVVGYLLLNQQYTGNTYIPAAMGLAGYALAIIELVGVLLAAGIPEKMRRTSALDVYENDKANIRNSLLKMSDNSRRIRSRRSDSWFD